jgi:sulfur carrier protein
MSATIQINGTTEVLSASTIAELLAVKEIPTDGRGLAVAVNGIVIGHAAWGITNVNAGDKIEIVHARQGG